MREKSKYRGLETGFFGTIYEAFQYLAVTHVHSVKCANGNHSLMWKVFKMRNVMDCFQLIKK